MTQESITLNTTPPYSGADLVDDLNKALQSLGTDFAGSVDPAAVGGVGPYVTWADTANNLLKRRNAADTAWEVEGVLFKQPLPIYAEVDIPSSDIGPIYVIGKGAYEWDGVSAYAPALIAYDNTTSGLAATDVQEAIDALAFAGKVELFAGPVGNIPDGWLLCDGSELSRTTYARLFTRIGTTYGVGDGSTTFKIPDLRGEFIRGLDNGRGVDVGRSLGSVQLDSVQDHQHGPGTSGRFYNMRANISGYAPTYNPGASVSDDLFDNTTGNMVTGRASTETRPRNVALNYIIKY